MSVFTCDVCQQELGLEEQSFDLEGACNNCALEEQWFKCSCCGDTFSAEEQGTCDDLCQDCDEETE